MQKIVVVRSNYNGKTSHWYASFSQVLDAYQPFMPAPHIDAALQIGAAAWRDCPGCGHNEVMRSDDYICINCREDPWLDLSPQDLAGIP